MFNALMICLLQMYSAHLKRKYTHLKRYRAAYSVL